MVDTSKRGKTYAQRKAEAKERTTKLVKALKSEGKKVTGTTIKEVAQEEKLRYTSSSGEIKESFIPQPLPTGPTYKVTTSLYQTQYGETAPSTSEQTLTPEKYLLNKQGQVIRKIEEEKLSQTKSNNFFESELIKESSKKGTRQYKYKLIKDDKGLIIGYVDPFTKQTVMAKKGEYFSEDSFKKAEKIGSGAMSLQAKRKIEAERKELFKQSEAERKRFSTTKYSIIGEVNEAIDKALGFASEKYVPLYEQAREKQNLVLGKGMIVPKKESLPSFDKFVEEKGIETVKTGLNVGTYFIPYVGAVRMAVDVVDFVSTASTDEGRSMIKANPLESSIWALAVTVEASTLASKGTKYFSKEQRAYRSVTKELKDISKQKVKDFKIDYTTTRGETTRSPSYSELTKTKTTVKDIQPYDKVIGKGKGRNLFFDDVVDVKTGNVERIVTSSKYPDVKFKISYDAAKGISTTRTFWKGELTSTTTSSIPKLSESKIKKTGITTTSKPKLSETKLEYKSTAEQKEFFKSKEVFGKTTAKTTIKQTSEIKKPLRELDYEILIKKGEYKNILTSRKPIKTTLAIGEQKANPDDLITLNYPDPTGKQVTGFIDKNIRAPRTQTSLIVESSAVSRVQTIYKPSIAELLFNPDYSPSSKYIFSGALPIPAESPTGFVKIDSSVSSLTSSKVTVDLATAQIDSSALKSVTEASILGAELSQSITPEVARTSFNFGFVSQFKPKDDLIIKEQSKVKPVYESNLLLQSEFKTQPKSKLLADEKTKIEPLIKDDYLVSSENKLLVEDKTKVSEDAKTQFVSESKVLTEAQTDTSTIVDVGSFGGSNIIISTQSTGFNMSSPSANIPISGFNFPFFADVSLTKAKKGKKLKKNVGYNVYVKRKKIKKGKGSYLSRGYKKANKKPLTEKGAKVKGAEIVDKYTNRSFFIKKAKSKAQSSYKDSNWNSLKNKFRPQKNNKNIFVEKSKHAIDSLEEKKGIPFESKRQRTKKKILGF